MSENIQNNIAEMMRSTRHERLSAPPQRKNETPPTRCREIEFREKFDLPDPEVLSPGTTDILEIMEERRSRRRYTDKSLTDEELSLMLYYTQGVQRELSGEKTMRTVPSAGARHALETFLYLDRAENLPRGLYHYRPLEHSLALLEEGDFSAEMGKAALGQEHVKNAAAVFIWAADSMRMAWRYSERAVRYIHLDAGHVCQNLYLVAQEIEAGVCAIAAYDDDYINELLDLDGQKDFVVYMASVGSLK